MISNEESEVANLNKAPTEYVPFCLFRTEGDWVNERIVVRCDVQVCIGVASRAEMGTPSISCLDLQIPAQFSS